MPKCFTKSMEIVLIQIRWTVSSILFQFLFTQLNFLPQISKEMRPAIFYNCIFWKHKYKYKIQTQIQTQWRCKWEYILNAFLETSFSKIPSIIITTTLRKLDEEEKERTSFFLPGFSLAHIVFQFVFPPHARRADFLPGWPPRCPNTYPASP